MKKKSANIGTTLMLLVILAILTYFMRERESVATAALTETTTTKTQTLTTSTQTFERMEIPVLNEVRCEQIIEHIAYTVSYNEDWHLPNWVAYELTNTETQGEEGRSDKFLPDPLVKGDPVVTKDYSNSGYDRGHMAPAADMRWSNEAMRESFYMTNICPQNHNNNAGDWKELEELGRDFARRYGAIYIACGPILGENPSSIGTARKILVPEAFYKVFLRQKENGDWTSIGFVMQNKAQSKPLMTYMMSVNDIEAMTHIDFFPTLPDEIEEKVEDTFEVADWTVK